MSILDNAVTSIQLGIEDYFNHDPRRGISAVRNIYAGLLLLYKEQLRRCSPDNDEYLLVRRDIKPKLLNGVLVFKGGRNTVDLRGIEERFQAFDIQVDWVEVKALQRLRNDIEHYFSVHEAVAIRELITKCFILIRDFITRILSEEPIDIIGEDYWAKLLSISDIYTREENECKNSIDHIDWPQKSVLKYLRFLRCPNCHSGLVRIVGDGNSYPSIEMRCKSCNNNFDFEEVIEECVSSSLSFSEYQAVKYGQDWPYDECYECDKRTFVFDEGLCIVCGYTLDYSHCMLCGTELSMDEQEFEGYCGYHKYKLDMIMDE